MFKDIFLPCLWAFLSSLVFCGIFNVRDKKIILISAFGGGLGWFAYLLSAPLGSVVMQNLIAAITVALFSEFMSRIFKTPSTVFLVIGVLPMVPGGGIYYTMEYGVQGNTAMFIEKGLETISIAGAIAVGVSIASAIFRLYTYFQQQQFRQRENMVIKYDRDNNK
ncbi:MAG: threonine/serine exporter family protein [Oscillospiraceae bacterium]|nr:threonine/serine exporter family protein [Oscillospiraceae bacterium]